MNNSVVFRAQTPIRRLLRGLRQGEKPRFPAPLPMIPIRAIKRVLANYPEDYRPEAVAPFAHTGLSGAVYWKIVTRNGPLCLRRWPRDTPVIDRLQYAQAVLWHAVCEGIDFVPLPVETRDHKGYVSMAEHCWELLPWMDGERDLPESIFLPGLPGIRGDRTEEGAVREKPSGLFGNNYRKMGAERIAAAMIALAQFHEATSTFPLPNEPIGRSEYANNRLLFWRQLTRPVRPEPVQPEPVQSEPDPLRCDAPGDRREAREWTSLASPRRREWAIRVREWHDFLGTLYPVLVSQLDWAAKACVSIQPCIGNAHRRHLLYDREGLAGIVDFKRTGVDSVARDIASLLGSLAGNDEKLRHYGLIAYGSIRPLSSTERRMIAVLDLEQTLGTSHEYLNAIRVAGNDFSPKQTEVMLDEVAWLHHRLASWNPERDAA